MRESQPKIILQYLELDDCCPFEEWFLGLRDNMGKAIIAARLEKIRLGHEGNEKPLSKGVYESKIHFGAGYRIYFGKEGIHRVILLCGGSKKRQSDDIARAQKYWSDYLETKYAKEK